MTKGKFFGAARNSVARGKLWALPIAIKSPNVIDSTVIYLIFFTFFAEGLVLLAADV